MVNTIIYIIFCHLIGDYVLQTDFIANTKGSNWYHMLVHCVLYCVPFVVMFGIDWRLLFVFAAHFAADTQKARRKKINYCDDQIIHYIAASVYLIF